MKTSLWRHPSFLLLWSGQTISMIGSAVTQLALPLTAIVLLDATPLQMGILLAVGSAASALVGLFAGAISDRGKRRPLLIIADLTRAAVMGFIPVAALFGILHIEYLYVSEAVMGALNSLFGSAYGAYLPQLVEKDRLVDANSRLEGSRVFANVVGPGAGGALIQALSAPIAIVLDAASFVISAFFLAIIPAREEAPVRTTERRNIWREVGEGLRVSFGNRYLRSILITSMIFNLAAPILNAQIFLYASKELHLEPAFLGLVFIASGGCGVLAATLTGRVTRRLGVGLTMTLATLMISGGWLIIPFLQGPLSLVVALFSLGAAIGTSGDVLFNINAATTMQRVTPNHLMGRVRGTMLVVILGIQPLGAIVGGVLGETIGLRLTVLIAGLGFFAGFISIAVSPLRRVREVESVIETPVDEVAVA